MAKIKKVREIKPKIKEVTNESEKEKTNSKSESVNQPIKSLDDLSSNNDSTSERSAPVIRRDTNETQQLTQRETNSQTTLQEIDNDQRTVVYTSSGPVKEIKNYSTPLPDAKLAPSQRFMPASDPVIPQTRARPVAPTLERSNVQFVNPDMQFRQSPLIQDNQFQNQFSDLEETPYQDDRTIRTVRKKTELY